MTSPPEQITVQCPGCSFEYEDWYRPSINLNLGEDFSDEYLREASTATCPKCGFTVELSTLVIRGDVWQFGPGS